MSVRFRITDRDGFCRVVVFDESEVVEERTFANENLAQGWLESAYPAAREGTF